MRLVRQLQVVSIQKSQPGWSPLTQLSSPICLLRELLLTNHMWNTPCIDFCLISHFQQTDSSTLSLYPRQLKYAAQSWRLGRYCMKNFLTITCRDLKHIWWLQLLQKRKPFFGPFVTNVSYHSSSDHMNLHYNFYIKKKYQNAMLFTKYKLIDFINSVIQLIQNQ